MPLKKAVNLSKTKAKTREKADLLIVNADELITLAGGNQKPRIGRQMRELGIIPHGALAVKDGRIVAVGKTIEVTKAFKAENVIAPMEKLLCQAL